mgnify:FL=1
MSGLATRWVISDPSGVGWFADALREVMTERDLSVGAVARKLETSPSLVRKWRAGTSVPSVERAAQIADALHVSYERLCLPGGAAGAPLDRRLDPVALAETEPLLGQPHPRTAPGVRETG